jgi:hypothetical protein
MFGEVLSRAVSTHRAARLLLFGCAGLYACTLYDEALLEDASGAGGSSSTVPGSGGSDPAAGGAPDTTPDAGSDGAGATGGETDGSGGTSLAGSAGAPGLAGTSGSSGAGAAGGNGGVAGAAGEDGQGGSEGGASGDSGCNPPPGCDCSATADACAALAATLVHRYDFSGTGTAVVDGAGARDGEVIGTALAGDGTLRLAGGVALEGEPLQHVAFPGGCLNQLVNATFEVWFDWDVAGSAWQRVFDFGELSTATTGTSLWFSPLAGTGTSASSRAGLSAESPGTGYMNQILVSGPVLSAGARHAALVADDTGNMLTLYLDGIFAGAQALPRPLANVNAENCWLGRSNDATDPYFGGKLDEFRVYDAALDAEAIAFSFEAGPNPRFLAP